MEIKGLKILREDERGVVYNCDVVECLIRNKGSVSGDNDINEQESLYLIEGEARVTVGDDIEKVSAPSKIEIPEKTYHKIEALTDIKMILYPPHE